MDGIATKERILAAAENEFLEKGFRGASLRNIVKTANVTTGAFYGYYNSKEELFDDLVEEAADYFLTDYKRVQTNFKALTPAEQQSGMGETASDWMIEIIDYIYAHSTSFKLILQCSEGTKYENFVHEMVKIEVDATHDFISVLENNGCELCRVDKNLEHILISGMFSAFFEIVIHDMPHNLAREYIKQLCAFYTAGWAKIMGL